MLEQMMPLILGLLGVLISALHLHQKEKISMGYVPPSSRVSQPPAELTVEVEWLERVYIRWVLLLAIPAFVFLGWLLWKTSADMALQYIFLFLISLWVGCYFLYRDLRWRKQAAEFEGRLATAWSMASGGHWSALEGYFRRLSKFRLNELQDAHAAGRLNKLIVRRAIVEADLARDEGVTTMIGVSMPESIRRDARVALDRIEEAVRLLPTDDVEDLLNQMTTHMASLTETLPSDPPSPGWH